MSALLHSLPAVPHPNAVWHIEGNLTIHCGIDGYSRVILLTLSVQQITALILFYASFQGP